MITKICKICGKEFLVKKCNFERSKYCSRPCSNLSKKGKTAWNKGLKMPGIVNSGCFKKGNTPPLKGKHHTEESKEKLRLAKAGKPSTSNTKFESGVPSWNKNKHIEAISGEKHHNWKGGKSSENVKIRASLEYKMWREACFLRDKFTCQKTGQVGGKLRCHHIQNFSDNVDLRLDISNGITLSFEAHNKFHKIYGIKNNTKEQLIEFLNNSN